MNYFLIKEIGRSIKLMVKKLNRKIRNNILNLTVFRKIVETSLKLSYMSKPKVVPRRLTDLVTIIMSVKDCEITIRRSLESLIVQSHTNLEIIVINDGSGDNTKKIVEQIMANDTRIRLVSLDTSFGTSLGRNLGLSICNGQYITFQDGDDYSHPRRIEKQLKAISKNNRLQVVLCEYVRITENDKLVRINSKWIKNCIVSMMFSRKTFRIIGYFENLPISEDSDYFERIIATYGNSSVNVLNSILYKASFSPGSRLFGKGEISMAKEKVIHTKCFDESLVDRDLRNKIILIKRGTKKPYLGKKKALRTFYEHGWISPQKNKVAIILERLNANRPLDLSLTDILQQDYGRNNLTIIFLADSLTANERHIVEQYRYQPYAEIITDVSPSITDKEVLIKYNCQHLMKINIDSEIMKNTVSKLVETRKKDIESTA